MCEPGNHDNGASDVWACLTAYTDAFCKQRKKPPKTIWIMFLFLISKLSLHRDTQFGQELALVMQTTHAQRMRSADSIPMCRLEFVFFNWKCTQVLQKSFSLSIKHAKFSKDLTIMIYLRHLVAFSQFEWFISSDHKFKNFSTHFIHKL